MALTAVQTDFLRSRGYTPDLTRADGVFGVVEEHNFNDLVLRDQVGFIAWPVFSMSGQTIGVQTRSIIEKRYRWKQNPETHHLPICFATRQDYQLMWETKECVITEGAFDRAPIKLAFPERAVIARLSKGAANQLAILLSRYCTVLWTAFDNDQPGIDATEATEVKLMSKMTVNKLDFPDHDPSRTLERKGVNGVRELLKKQFDALGGW